MLVVLVVALGVFFWITLDLIRMIPMERVTVVVMVLVVMDMAYQEWF